MRVLAPLALGLALAIPAVTVPALAAPAMAARAEPVWAPEDQATIHPGVQTYSEGQCTANFVFTDADGGVYLGSAAHCAGTDGSTQVDGCRAGTLPPGIPVEVAGAAHPATMVYSSWAAMQQRQERDPDVCRYNDFALLRLDPRDIGRVNPTIPFYGGPHGLAEGTSPGDPVFSYGNSSLRFGASTLSPKRGWSLGQGGGGWTHDVYTATPGISGDSGSAFVDAAGRAFGVLATLEAAPQPGSNGVTDLPRALDYLTAATGLVVVLADGTRTFDGSLPVEPDAGPPQDRVVRLSGPSRVETAVAVSRDAFADQRAGAVVLARSDDFADALAATPLAASLRAPLLLTTSEGLHPATRDELQRVLPAGEVVYLLGGATALSPAVEADVRAHGYQVRRVWGPSRFETAAAIADAVTADPREVLLADGLRFADALVAGPAAHRAGGVVLLTDGDRAHPAVDRYLAGHGGATVVTVGTTASAAYPGRRSHAAATDQGTAVAVAEAYFADAAAIGVARVDVFADALAGGAHVARLMGPVLLSDQDRLPPVVADHLRAHAERIGTGFLYGGTGALSEQVERDVRAAIS